ETGKTSLPVPFDRTGHPFAGIENRKEITPIRPEADRRDAADPAIGRGIPEPAEKFEGAEMRLLGAGDEPLDDMDRKRREFACRRDRESHKTAHKRPGNPADGLACNRPQPASRALPRLGWPPLSSKRAASCSVMAPASSSASTMVTALR